ncbi:hypothetical protein ACM64Y_01835 [Novispirillum sp. DQ9]|uniref:hypothetical protein n=1 Tax=Novispirillum sp. DQ9 TaxID=3398612 RepID=UPI003C7A8A26
MQFLAGALWWAITKLFGWVFSALGLAAVTRFVAGLLVPFAGGAARWLSYLLVGGTVAGGVAYTGIIPRVLNEVRLLGIDFVVWLVDGLLGLGLGALAQADALLPSVSSAVGWLPVWVLQLMSASGFGYYASICLGAAVVLKLISLIPGVKI